MPKEKKVFVEVPERLAKVLERLVKADELGEQMASGKEKLDWRRLSSVVFPVCQDTVARGNRVS